MMGKRSTPSLAMALRRIHPVVVSSVPAKISPSRSWRLVWTVSQIGPVVHGHLGFHFRAWSMYCGVAVFAFDGKVGISSCLAGSKRPSSWVLSEIGGADVDRGPPALSRWPASTPFR